MQRVSGNIVDVLNSRMYPGTLIIKDGRIADIMREDAEYGVFIIPGLVDSHCHIESSMMAPSEFARLAAVHGTVAVVCDPHEIANVLGVDGVNYMIEASVATPLKTYYGAPSCVPATVFETSGAIIGPDEIEQLLRSEDIKCLAEVMNFPGVICNDPVIQAKIGIAKKYSKPVDGHAPGLRGEDLERYIKAGITTDHECVEMEEALEKVKRGMKVMIREGSAARNFDDLIPLVEENSERCMFCTDDKHPDELLRGHMNDLVKRALNYGIDLMKVLRVACVNPVLHYGLDVGLLRKGDSADFVVLDNIRDINILKTCIKGRVVAEGGRSLTAKMSSKIVNNFKTGKKRVEDFLLPYKGGNINVIGALEGRLTTEKLVVAPKIVDGCVVSDVQRDVLKIAVINRYQESKASIGFVRNFGLRVGAIASSVAHDSHNIVAVGVTDEDICRAVNLIIEEKGGISAVSGGEERILPLPIAGLMSDRSYHEIAENYVEMNTMAGKLGSPLRAPFMTLSFMALPVIPKMKLTDGGLFDSERFEFISVFAGGCRSAVS